MTDNGGGMIGGVTFKSLGLMLTKASIPIMPDIRQTEEEIPGRDGVLDLGTRFGARMIELTFQVIADTETAYQTALQQIAAVFSPHRGQQILILDRMSGKQWKVKVSGSIPVEKLLQIGEFTVQLKAHEPFAESVIDSTQALKLGMGLTLGQGFKLGQGKEIYTVTASPTTITVTNRGTYYAQPLITLKGAGTNPQIENLTTGELMSWTGSLANGTLALDCDKQTAELNGINAFPGFAGTFIKLAPGENTIKITAAGANLTASFLFRHTYIY